MEEIIQSELSLVSTRKVRQVELDEPKHAQALSAALNGAFGTWW